MAAAAVGVDLLFGSSVKSDDPFLQPDLMPSTTGARITGCIASASALLREKLSVQMAGYLRRNAENLFGVMVAD
jgi:hypothetical protein